MSTKKLTLADIAALVGVSKSTVSFVLNGHAEKHRITPATVAKVQAVVDKYNYAPSLYARALKSKQTFTFGLVLPDLTNMGFASIAKELEVRCRKEGYQLLIASSEDNLQQEKKAVNSLLARQVDALIVASVMIDDSFYQKIHSATPVVLFDRHIEGTTLPSIYTDALSATTEVVTRLASEVEECVYIGGLLDLQPSKARYEGYVQGINLAGHQLNLEHVLHRDYEPQSGYEMMQEYHRNLGRLPQSLFTASYSLLEGVLRYLSEHRLLNEGMRIASFDNYSILDCLPISIDSIEQDCTVIADEILIQIINAVTNTPSNPLPLNKPNQSIIAAKLHFRR